MTLHTDDPQLAGHGPSRIVEHTSPFESTLYVWARGDGFRPHFQIQDPAGEVLLDLDDHREFNTPCLYHFAEEGEQFRIVVAAPPGVTGEIELRLIDFPERPETRDAVEIGTLASEEIADLRAAGRHEEAVALLGEVVDELLELPGGDRSIRVMEAVAHLVGSDDGGEADAMNTSIRVWRHCVDLIGSFSDAADGYRIDYLAYLGYCLGAVGRVDEAVDVYRQRQEAIAAGRDDGDLVRIDSLIHLASRCFRLKRMEESEAAYEQAHELLMRCELPAERRLLGVIDFLSFFSMQRQDYPRILELTERALELVPRLPDVDPRVRGRVLSRLSTAAGELGDLETYHEADAAAVEIVTGELPPGDSNRVLVLLAHGRRWLDVDAEEAATRIERLLDELVTTGKETTRRGIRARGELASLLRYSEPARARTEARRAYQLARDHLRPDVPEYTTVVRYMRDVLDAGGDLSAGRVLMEDHLERCREALPPDSLMLGMAARDVAYSILRAGRNDPDFGERALELLAEADSIYARYYLPQSQERLDLAYKRGQFQGMLGQSERARDTLRVVLQQAQEAPHLDTYGWFDELRAELARYEFEAGDLESSIALWEPVVERARTRTDVALRSRAKWLILFAGVLTTGERRAEARPLLAAALDLLRKHFVACLLDPPSSAWRRAGDVQTLLGNAVALILEQGWLEELGAELFETLATQRMVSYTALGGERPDAVLSDLRAQRLELSSELTSWVRPGRATGAGSASASRRSSRIVDLTTERDRVEALIAERLALIGRPISRPDPRVVAEHLKSDEALVSYRRVNGRGRTPVDRLLAAVVRPRAPLKWLDLGDASAVSEVVSDWRARLGRPCETRGLALAEEGGATVEDDALLAETSHELRRLVLDPVLDEVGDVRRLYVVLDHVLLLLPLEALPTREGPGVVGDHLDVRPLLSLAELLEASSPTADKQGLVLVGGVDYDASSDENRIAPAADLPSAVGAVNALARSAWSDGDFAPLPGTVREVRAIAERFEMTRDDPPLSLLRGRQADKRALLEQLSSARFVHIATHGWFAPVVEDDDESNGREGGWRPDVSGLVSSMAPMALCGLALAGANGADRGAGILTAEELAGVDLWGCELAVLSACETNVGLRRSGQGIRSLQAALHSAGVRTTVTSLWKVDDAATARLMDRFYANLWEQDQPPREALWAAKRSLREEGAPLVDWSGWVLMGGE